MNTAPSLRLRLRCKLQRLLDQLLPPPRLSGAQKLERRMIVGTIADDSSWALAETARALLAVETSVSDCRELVRQSRRLFAQRSGMRHHNDVQLPGFRTYRPAAAAMPKPPLPPAPAPARPAA